jgi:hypothetical protein
MPQFPNTASQQVMGCKFNTDSLIWCFRTCISNDQLISVYYETYLYVANLENQCLKVFLDMPKRRTDYNAHEILKLRTELQLARLQFDLAKRDLDQNGLAIFGEFDH